MTTHQLYKEVAAVLSPKNANELFDYIIHSMEGIGLALRSRYCYRDDKILPNEECGEVKTVLLALSSPFDFDKSTDYYEKNASGNPFTVLKMQLFVIDLSDEEAFLREAVRSAAVGFDYPIRVDLAEKRYEILEPVSISGRKHRSIAEGAMRRRRRIAGSGVCSPNPRGKK